MKQQSYITKKEFIDSALQFEDDSAQYYRDMEKLTDREEVKELLDELSAQEVAHGKALRQIRLTEVDEYIQFPPDFDLSMITLDSEDPGFDEVLDIAIEREKKSVEIYENAAQDTTGGLKQLCEDLMKFEQVHVRQLKELKNR